MQYKGWEGFVPGKWSEDEVDVRDFIQRNYTPYEGDSSFLAPPTEATKKLWDIVLDLSKKEREAGRCVGRGYQNRLYAHFARGGLSRQRPRKNRGLADG